MTPERWNRLNSGARIVRTFDRSEWEVVNSAAIPETAMGHKRTHTLRRVSPDLIEATDGGFWEEGKGG
jgi:hypothetical protein